MKKQKTEQKVSGWVVSILMILLVISAVGILWAVVQSFIVSEKYEFIGSEEVTNCLEGETIYNLTSLTQTIPECTCFRIDSTIVNFNDVRIGKVDWDGGEDVNKQCCDIPFESEILMRQDKDWKCKCSFDWSLNVKKTKTVNCTLESYDLFNHTYEKCIDPCWNGEEEYEKVTEVFKNLTKTTPINYTVVEEEIKKNDIYEKIIIHRIMEVETEPIGEESAGWVWG